jgi:DNA polymerase-1
LTDLFKEVEMPLVRVLMDMEMAGVSVDRERLQDLSKSFEMQMEGLEKKIYAIAGEPFNINSSQQLGHILFDKLGLPAQKKTKKKTGYSTDVNVLTTLAQKHELPALILRYRTLTKLKSTYTDALVGLIHPNTGRIHTSYNQTVTATGRLSSSDPNLQNIPIRTEEGREIRSAFIPRRGWSFVAADYSQIELRILAHCSDDQILIKAFKEDEDIHTRTAAEVFQVFPSFIDKELRQQAKAINFGIVYGQSAFGLSNQLGISRKMAQTYINNYFARYSGVRQFIDNTIEIARQTQKTTTLLGRIRLLPDIASTNATTRKFAERTAINTPIQGTAADLIKLAMIKAADALHTKNLKSVMLLSVHDEIVFEVPPDELEAVKALAKEVMEGIWDLKVPLKVNVVAGDNWAQAH